MSIGKVEKIEQTYTTNTEIPAKTEETKKIEDSGKKPFLSYAENQAIRDAETKQPIKINTEEFLKRLNIL